MEKRKDITYIVFMISVAIIEDIQDIREPLAEFISEQPEFILNGATESVEEYFIQNNKDELPDVILLDIGLPGISGLGAIAMFKKRIPEADIIMLTIHDDAARIFRALQIGASGYLLKNTPLIKIKEAIINVMDGGAAMSPAIARKVIKFFGEQNEAKKECYLSEKEQLIVAYLVDGLSFKMIANNINLSIDTVKYHAKNIYKKLQVNTKAEVIAKSVRGEI